MIGSYEFLLFLHYLTLQLRETTKNGFLDFGNVRNKEISRIRETQSSVPSRTCETGN